MLTFDFDGFQCFWILEDNGQRWYGKSNATKSAQIQLATNLHIFCENTQCHDVYKKCKKNN